MILVPGDIVWLHIYVYNGKTFFPRVIHGHYSSQHKAVEQLSILICKRSGRIKMLNCARLKRQQLYVEKTNPSPAWSGYPFFLLVC